MVKLDQEMIRAVRNLCPKKGSGITSVTFSAGGRSVVLTSKERDKANAMLKDKGKGDSR